MVDGLTDRLTALMAVQTPACVALSRLVAMIAMAAWLLVFGNREEPAVAAEPPLAIGDRRELFVDGRLVESLRNARRELHHPVPRELAITHDAAWEGAGSGYHSVFRDGELYRMYYRGTKLGVDGGKLRTGPEVYCYAESRDGVTFTKPDLQLFEHNGSKQNNIIWTGVGTHNFAPFLDSRPGCPPESRF